MEEDNPLWSPGVKAIQRQILIQRVSSSSFEIPLATVYSCPFLNSIFSPAFFDLHGLKDITAFQVASSS